MDKIDQLASGLLSSIDERDARKTSAYDTQAEIRNIKGNTAWVHIPGGVDETPVALTINANIGDQVMVRVSGGKAWIVGNASSPPTDDARANAAYGMATDASELSRIAGQAATEAQVSAMKAEKSANDAEEEAQRANSAANSAVEGLSLVQRVVDVANWIAEHGEMVSQAGGTFDPAKVYFVVDPNGDYHIGNTHYSVVQNPKAEDIDSYYILNINESVQNYVMTHLFVDAEGLWLIPEKNATAQTSSKKILIAVGGQGHTYETAGTYIIGADNISLAGFMESGATIGRVDGSHSVMDENGQRFYASDGTTQLANIGYGEGASQSGTAIAPYYTFGQRSAGSQVGNYSVAEGDSIIASGYASHAEGFFTTASSYYSHAEGSYTTAGGDYSHAQNLHTIASRKSQTVLGEYNIVDTQGTSKSVRGKYAIIVGNGTANIARSNAFAVDWDGDVEIALDTLATSGVDKEIYDALVELGWDSDVIV